MLRGGEFINQESTLLLAPILLRPPDEKIYELQILINIWHGQMQCGISMHPPATRLIFWPITNMKPLRTSLILRCTCLSSKPAWYGLDLAPFRIWALRWPLLVLVCKLRQFVIDGRWSRCNLIPCGWSIAPCCIYVLASDQYVVVSIHRANEEPVGFSILLVFSWRQMTF